MVMQPYPLLYTSYYIGFKVECNLGGIKTSVYVSLG